MPEKVAPVLDPAKALEGLRRLYREAVAQGIQLDPQIQVLGLSLRKMVEGGPTSLFPGELDEARKQVEEGMAKGITCPCCGQLCKLYKRKLNAGMAKALLWLVRWHIKNGWGAWVHVNNSCDRATLKTAGDVAKLRYWHFIEAKANEDTKKRTSGIWKMTQKGRDFVLGKITAPGHVRVYNQQVMGFSDVQITFREALGDHFDYEELMKEIT